MASKKTLRICEKGHRYFKSSDCLICPVCEENRKPADHFLSMLAAPARRALESNGIITIHQLSKYSEVEILKLHGIGKSSIPKLKKMLTENGFTFKD